MNSIHTLAEKFLSVNRIIADTIICWVGNNCNDRMLIGSLRCKRMFSKFFFWPYTRVPSLSGESDREYHTSFWSEPYKPGFHDQVSVNACSMDLWQFRSTKTTSFRITPAPYTTSLYVDVTLVTKKVISACSENLGGIHFRAADLILPVINSWVSPRIQAYSSVIEKISTGILERSPGSVSRKMLTYLFWLRMSLISSRALWAYQSMSTTQSVIAQFAMKPSLRPSKLSTLMTLHIIWSETIDECLHIVRKNIAGFCVYHNYQDR